MSPASSVLQSAPINCFFLGSNYPIMKSRSRNRQPEHFWPKVVMRKWLNISAKDSDYSADTEDEDDTDSASDPDEFFRWTRESRFRNDKEEDTPLDLNDALPRMRRRKSETFRAQYINTKELRISVATWNIGGKPPPDDLDIDDWIGTTAHADMYVIGFQEIIPLNAGNILGAEDSRPVPKWENIIRETLDRTQPANTKFKCYSDPPSPSRFKPCDDLPNVEEEVLLETDSDGEEEIHPINDESNGFIDIRDQPVIGETVYANPESRTEGCQGDGDSLVHQKNKVLNRTLSGTERIGLSWPEPPLDLLAQHVLDRPNALISTKSFKAVKSFKRYSSFKSATNGDNEMPSHAALLAEFDIDSLMYRKRRPQYVRIVSKQMVGIFLTIWVRRSLRKHIQNVNVSTVGVGVMGYIGNKGSISVSMSIYQTLFCFVCSHLTSGENEADAIKRNADVQEIHRRTHFNYLSGIGLPKTIYDHERIIWLGDLNYRINLSYEKTRELISKRCWSKLVENDQLGKELKAGRAFDGWREGTLTFPPTYKYEFNSEKYYGDDPRAGRRTPAWCDRILSYGKGMRLLSYRRTEHKLSDHRPVAASYMVEVEVFSPRRLQRALTFTDAEIEEEEVLTDMGIYDV